ncbi:MAG: GAF domain-containing protein [Chloroflexi bacterium]|nr:GAF domain-containing protein [Chloroflexota bacterium]
MTEETNLSEAITPPSDKHRLMLLQAISLAVNQAESVDAAFTDVLAYICRFMRWPLGHVYVWSEATDELVSSRIWHMVDPVVFSSFRQLSEATQFQRGQGTLGRVWESGKAISILDVHTETMFRRKLPVEEGGIRAYFAFPVIVEGRVTAVLEFFSPEAVAPDEDIIAVITHVGALLGLAMRRQKTLARLRNSETQLAEAQRTAHIGHWEWDIVRDKVSWSPELYRIYGLSPDTPQITYQDFLAWIHPDDVAYTQQKVASAYQNGRSFDHFHRIIRSDGSMRVLHARGHPIYDHAGRIVKLYGTAQDMTELKETELTLAQTVRTLSALMEIGQTVSATLDLELIYERVLSLGRPLIKAEALILFLHKENMLEIVAMDQENIPDMRGVCLPSGSGIAGEVWRRGQPLLVKGEACIRQLSPILEGLTDYRPQTIIAAPVRWQDKAIGVLEAIHQEIDTFDEEDMQLLETVASWTAIAIGNAHQYEQLQRRLMESDAITTISNALIETLDLDELLQLIVNKVQSIIPEADWAVIHLLQTKTNTLELAASAGIEVAAAAHLMDLGKGIAGEVITHGGVINIADMQTDPRRLTIDASINAHSLLVAPVESRQSRIGTISVQCATPSAFTTDDERLLTIFGIQAGMAIENARLYAAQQKARQKAEKQRERMRHMARRVVEAQEKERARIARELHDESGQSLTSLKISLDLLRSLLPPEMMEIKENLGDVLSLVDKTMNNLRLLAHNLRPPGLDAYGLDAALAGLCHDFQTHTTLQVTYTGIDLPNLAALPALSLYRFAQEALTNAAKHAQATWMKVTLNLELDMIILLVEDNGEGFSPPDIEESLPTQGAGLVGMIERLEMVNGRLHIESIPGQGSRLTAVVPFMAEET